MINGRGERKRGLRNNARQAYRISMASIRIGNGAMNTLCPASTALRHYNLISISKVTLRKPPLSSPNRGIKTSRGCRLPEKKIL